jgi:hypothetical protein
VDDSVGRRARHRLAFYGVIWVLLCLFFVVFGAFDVWGSYHRLPHTYARLRAHGMPATASLVKCAPGIGGGRGVGCRVSLGFAGHVRTWNYPEDAHQFDGLRAGAPIPVLVDPSEPTTVYTVRDVERRTNAGASSPVLWFGVVLVGIGLAGFAWLVRLAGVLPRIAGAPRLRRSS